MVSRHLNVLNGNNLAVTLPTLVFNIGQLFIGGKHVCHRMLGVREYELQTFSFCVFLSKNYRCIK